MHGSGASEPCGFSVMAETIHIDDLTFEVRRSSRRKTIGVTIERDAALIAHLPMDVGVDEAAELIRRRSTWVHQKLASRGGEIDADVFRLPEFVDGEGFHFLGRHYRLKLVDVPKGAAPVPTVRVEGDRLLLRREQAPAGERRIAAFYTRAAHPHLNAAVRKWKAFLGVRPRRHVKVLDLGFRWGSCSADGQLNFHWRIMQLPPQVIDYIVVHELAHLKIGDHSPEFWAEVGRVMPAFPQYRQWLRDRGSDL